MESKMELNKEKIFLCRKIKRSKTNKNYIFDIFKIKRNKKEKNLSFISNYKKNNNFYIDKDTFLLIDEFLVPSFLNDIIESNVQIQEKLKKYNEISFQFEDNPVRRTTPSPKTERYTTRSPSLYPPISALQAGPSTDSMSRIVSSVHPTASFCSLFSSSFIQRQINSSAI